MRLKYNSRWIPQGFRPFTRTEDTDAAIWVGEVVKENGRTMYEAIYYHGKANKHDSFVAYRSAKHRADAIKQYIDGRKSRNQMLADRRAEHNKPHTLQVGDILMNSWGYDQTNIDYYEVTRVIGPHTVEICEIGQDRTQTAFMQGNCVAQKGHFIGKPMIKRADSSNSVKIHEWGSWAHKVDPLHVAHYTEYA